MEGIELSSISVTTVHDALRAFGEVRFSNGKRVLPIVATPTNAGFPWVSVPDGVAAFCSVQGVIDEKPMLPGFHFLAPWSYVKYVVTPQFTVFDTPCKDCPTKDNSMVGIDVFLVFRIYDAKKFIDNLSAEKLGDLLKAAQEEAVRNLARSTNHQDIYDLVRYDESTITKTMDLKFHDFGVEVTDVMITDVKLRADIQQRLEQETVYQSKNSLQKRKQEFEMTVLKNKEYLSQRQLEMKNKELAYEQEEITKRANIAKEIDEIYARRDKLLAEIQAEQNRVVQNIHEEAKKHAAQYQSQKSSLLTELRAKSQALADQVNADQLAHNEKVRSGTRLLVSQCDAKSTEILGKAEKNVSSKMKTKREFTLQENRVQIWKKLMSDGASRGHILVQGDTSGNIVAALESVKQQQSLYNKAFTA